MLNLKKEFLEIKSFLNILKERKFDNKNRLALKNSSYQLLISLSMKIGSLIFTIIMARLLLPEKMGLYSLALSTIVFFSAFSDLGLGNAIFMYIPKKISQKKFQKAKGYFNFLLKLKLIITSIVSLTLILLSKFISSTYYNKPIFYALIVGAFYLFINNILGFYEQIFRSSNNFKTLWIKEIIFQLFRLFLIPISLIFLLRYNVNDEFLLFIIFLLLTMGYFISFLYLLKKSKKEIEFLKSQSFSLSKKEEKNVFKFLFPLTITSLSGIFFGYIDIIMLGRYVQSEFISYYTTAFNLIASLSVIIGFISVGVFPLLSSLRGNQLKNIFNKALKYSFIISLFSSLFTLIFSNLIINLLYGKEYALGAIILRFYSVLILISPLISLYENYFISQRKTKTLASLIILTTLINIILNFFFIRYGVRHFNGLGGILGACFATIISRLIYLVGLILRR
ncbi:oligosaccharide flippase family protein [Candidatus Woesearchaeota archaeon]|nr:oligosaccharide flippase family protein [Candidatus Woesearchaeota archaeon]